MNARWFRENLSVVIFSVAFLAILGVLIWLVMGANEYQATVRQEFDAQNAELGHLRDAKPPLSDTSIQNVKQDRELISSLYTEMQRSAGRKAVQVKNFNSEIDFSLLLQSNITALGESAAAHNVQVMESFSFGFSRYDATLPCRNPNAKGAECQKLLNQLGKQLVVVDKLATILISNRVDRLTSIRRTETESGSSADSLNIAIGEAPKGLYRSYPFELQFLCDTRTLRKILNDFVQADFLFVVRGVRIDSVVTKVKVPDAEPAVRTAGETNTVHSTEVEVRRLNVVLRLDFVEFTTPSLTAAAKS